MTLVLILLIVENAFSDKRTQMKKDKEPMERLAFHLVSNRDVALTIAKEGLRCKQLSLKIDKYLGESINSPPVKINRPWSRSLIKGILTMVSICADDRMYFYEHRKNGKGKDLDYWFVK